jgi:hypothetical protein
MEWWLWLIIVIAAVVVVGVVAWFALKQRRRQRLRQDFGPEYERTVRRTGDERRAASELEQRRERRERLEIRPLAPAACKRYEDDWRAVQNRFVDEPVVAVRDADALVTDVMRERGYPMDDFDAQADLISVDHPGVVENYREAHAIYLAYDRGDASTEDLRQAMVYYRSLFEELLETQPAQREREREVR